MIIANVACIFEKLYIHVDVPYQGAVVAYIRNALIKTDVEVCSLNAINVVIYHIVYICFDGL